MEQENKPVIIPARIEVDIDCGNCSMNKDEKKWIIDAITTIIESRSMKVTNIAVID